MLLLGHTDDATADAQGMFVLRALYWGDKGVRENYRLQIRNIVRAARERLGDVPIVFGECGVPMDLKWVLQPLVEQHGQSRYLAHALIAAARKRSRRVIGSGRQG